MPIGLRGIQVKESENAPQIHALGRSDVGVREGFENIGTGLLRWKQRKQEHFDPRNTPNHELSGLHQTYIIYILDTYLNIIYSIAVGNIPELCYLATGLP